MASFNLAHPVDRVRDRVTDKDMDRVRDRVRVRGLAIAAPSYSGPNRFQWGRKLEFAPPLAYAGITLLPHTQFTIDRLYLRQ